MKKSLISLLLMFSSIYSLAANSLTITPNKASVKPGKTVNFSVTGNTGNDLRWFVKGDVRELSLPGAVTDGKLEIHDGGTSVSYTASFYAGNYTLAVTDGKAIAIAQILVYDLHNAIISVEIVDGNRDLSIGTQQALSLQAWVADLSQQDKTQAADWKTSDDSIVAVDKGGIITAKAAGKAKITATIGDKTAEIEVTVKAEKATGLAVEPATVYLTTDSKHTIYVSKVFKSGHKQDVDEASCEFTSSSDAVTVNKTELEAVSQGYASIKVNCDDLQTQVAVFVNSALALETSPESLTLRAGTSANFSISGGLPPYTVTAEKGRVNGSSGRWNYIAARNANNDTITVTDQDGTKVTLSVKIRQGLVLSPQIIDLETNSNQVFTVARGLAPYTWQVTRGKLDKTQATEVTYTAPQTKGVYEISVVDQQGYVKRAVINVGGDLIASPNQLILNPDEEQKFYISGGTKPYKISASAGTSTEDEDDNFYYTAPSVAGNYSLTIRDKENKSTNINVTVQSILAVTPLELFLKSEEKAELNISGGYGKYTVAAKTGNVKQSNGKLSYTAAKDISGRDVITITDQAGNVEQVEVLVSQNGFYVLPAESYILPGKKVKLRGLGGTPPYTWTVKGEGDLSKNEGDRVTFTAPEVAGNYKIVIKDNSGKETEATVVVYQGELKLSPEILVIAPGKKAELTALLGVPDYVWNNDQVGALSATKGKTVTYTASEKESEDIVQLQDATGKVKTLRVVIKEKVNIVDLIAGEDGKVDEAEMDNALEDFFDSEKQGWIDETDLFLVIEEFLKK